MAYNSNQIKVVYVSANGYLGGAEKVVLTAATEHLKHGSIFPIIIFFREGEAVNEANRLGIQNFVLKNKFKLSSPYSLFNALIELRKLIKKLRPNILHHTMAYTHIVSSLATYSLDYKKVWFQHGPVGGILDKIAINFSTDWVLFNSYFLKELHHKSFPHSKIKKGEQVINLEVNSLSIQRKIFQREIPVFGAAGRICKGKAFREMIQIFSKQKKPFRLVIAGAPKSSNDISYFNELNDLVKKNHLEAQITFLGHQEDMKKFYLDIDVFIHASETPEPFGLVTAEAMGHGCLTLAKCGGGAVDFIVGHKNAISYTTWQELEKIVNQILNSNDVGLYNKIALLGQQTIIRKYSSGKMEEQLNEFYSSLMS